MEFKFGILTLSVIIFFYWIGIDKRQVLSATVAVSNLSCYECSDSFKTFWNPWTACQRNLTGVPLRQCHEKDRYCKVERISLKRITLKITRGCTSECYYGCKVVGYGLTQYRCTSCCQGSACNTGNGAKRLTLSYSAILCFIVPFSIFLSRVSL